MMRGQRYVVGAAVVIGALGIVGGSLMVTKKAMYATSWRFFAPQATYDNQGVRTLCPGQISDGTSGTDNIGSSTSAVHAVTVGHALNQTWNFPTTAVCYSATSCVPPVEGSAVEKACGARNGTSTTTILQGNYYGTSLTNVHSDMSVGRVAYWSTDSSSSGVPAKAKRATFIDNSSSVFAGECYTMTSSSVRKFAKQSELSNTICTNAMDCTTYCTYIADFT